VFPILARLIASSLLPSHSFLSVDFDDDDRQQRQVAREASWRSEARARAATEANEGRPVPSVLLSLMVRKRGLMTAPWFDNMGNSTAHTPKRGRCAPKCIY
jgi:hypothetical protein